MPDTLSSCLLVARQEAGVRSGLCGLGLWFGFCGIGAALSSTESEQGQHHPEPGSTWSSGTAGLHHSVGLLSSGGLTYANSTLHPGMESGSCSCGSDTTTTTTPPCRPLEVTNRKCLTTLTQTQNQVLAVKLPQQNSCADTGGPHSFMS